MKALDPRLEPISDEEYTAKAEAVAAFLRSPEARSKWGWEVNQERLDEIIADISDRDRMCQIGEMGVKVRAAGLADDNETLILELKALAEGDPTLEACAIDDLYWLEDLKLEIEACEKDAEEEGDEEWFDRLPQYQQKMFRFDITPTVLAGFKSIFSDRIELIEDPEITKIINLNFRTMDEDERYYYWSFPDEEEEQRLWEYNSDFMKDEKFRNEMIHKIQDDNRPINTRSDLLFKIREQAEAITETDVDEVSKEY